MLNKNHQSTHQNRNSSKNLSSKIGSTYNKIATKPDTTNSALPLHIFEFTKVASDALAKHQRTIVQNDGANTFIYVGQLIRIDLATLKLIINTRI